jgi:hypothetical protein
MGASVIASEAKQSSAVNALHGLLEASVKQTYRLEFRDKTAHSAGPETPKLKPLAA